MAALTTTVFLVGFSIVCKVVSLPCTFDLTTRFLDCCSRDLHHVPTENIQFKNAKGMDLSGNFIERIRNETFSTNAALKYLDLSGNGMAHLESAAFRGLTNLVILNLSRNDLELSPNVMTPELFQPLVSLQEIRIQNINFQESGWKGIDLGFGKLQNLTRLYIDFPPDFVFGRGFSKLKKLKTISTGGRWRHDKRCRIGVLRNSTFIALKGVNLRELRLINCGIKAIESGAWEPLTSVDTLDFLNNVDLGLNQAIKSLQLFQNRDMKEVRLALLNNISCDKGNHFIISSDNMFILQNMCIRSLDLSENYITYMDPSGGVKLIQCLEHFNISYHSVRCIPLFFYAMIFTSKTLKSLDISYGFGVPRVGIHRVEHSHPRLKPEESVDIRPGVRRIPPSLEELDMSGISPWTYLDSPITVLNGGNLTYLAFAYNNLGNCASLMIKGITNLTHLDLSGIACLDVQKEYFREMRNLKQLSLSYSVQLDVSSSSLTSFELLDVLENIDLSGNKIFELQPQLFQNNKRLQCINLSNNKLQRLPSAISHLGELRRLDLSGNAFTYLQIEEMALIDHWIVKPNEQKPFSLMMGGNPLQCTCDTVLFIRWIGNRKDNLEDLENYTCLVSNGSWVRILEFIKGIRNFEVNCASPTYIIVSVVGLSTFTLLISLLVAIYRYRLNLRYWLYTKLQPPKDMFADQEHIFDAFVAYTEEDREWVVKQLRAKFELNDSPIQLCIHDRDFTPGKPIHENIIEKMEQSRKILLVISKYFLESTYGPLEIEYAGMKCLNDGKEDIILCVLMEDIPVRQMPRALRNLWHKITFLKWSTDPDEQVIFWRNLTDALR